MELSLLDNFENDIVFEIVQNHKDDILKFIHVLDYINSKGLTIGTFHEKTKITDYVSTNFSNFLNDINPIIHFAKEFKNQNSLTIDSLSKKIKIQNNYSFDKILITGPSTGAQELILEDFFVNDATSEKATKGDSCTLKVPFRIRLSDKMYKIVEN